MVMVICGAGAGAWPVVGLWLRGPLSTLTPLTPITPYCLHYPPWFLARQADEVEQPRRSAPSLWHRVRSSGASALGLGAWTALTYCRSAHGRRGRWPVSNEEGKRVATKDMRTFAERQANCAAVWGMPIDTKYATIVTLPP